MFFQTLKQKIYSYLRLGEKYTKTDNIYLAKNTFWNTFGQFWSSGTSFLLAIAFANLLPKETYGIYKYVLSIFGILTIFTMSGINTALVQAVASGQNGSFLALQKEKIKWGLLGGLVSMGFSGYYYLHHNTTLTLAFLLAAFFLPFFDSFALYDSYLQAKKRFDLSNKYWSLSRVVGAILIFVALFLTKNVLWILLAYFIGYLAIRLFFTWLTIKKYQIKGEAGDSQTKRYGWHLSVISVISTAASNLDGVLVFHFLGPVQLAIYSFATSLPDQIKGPLKAMGSLMLPKFSERDETEIRHGMKNKFINFFLFNAVVVVVYFLAAPFVYKYFFPKYLGSLVYSQVYVLSYLSQTWAPASIFLTAKKYLKEQYLLNIWTSVIQLISMTVLLVFFGLWGLIAARVLTRFLSSLIQLYYYKKTETKAI